MKYIRNERGYVLIIVLLTIVIISTFAMVLIPKALNTSLQVNKTEKMTRTKELSEMGVQYTYGFLQSLVMQAILDVNSDPSAITTNHDKLFCEKLKARLSTTPFGDVIKMEANPDYHFQVGYLTEPITITSTNNTSCDGFKNMKIPVQSIGKIAGSTDKGVKAYFIIDNKGEITPGSGTGPVDPSTLPLVSVPNPVKLSGNTLTQMYSSGRFLSMVTIAGNGTLMVGGNAWFEGGTANSVDFNGNNGRLIISGNAYFKYPVNLGGTNTNYLCIRGNAYLLKKGTTNTWESYTEIAADKYCPALIQKEVQYYYDVNQWNINNDKLDVQY